MTSLTTAFSVDRVNHYIAVLELGLTQTNLTCAKHSNECFADRKSVLPLSRTKVLDNIRVSESTSSLKATDGNHMISG
jgi:hypothetical protein